MNWGAIDQQVLAHWRALGTFRARHVAIARGAHARIAQQPYVFSRVDAEREDRVVVAIGAAAGAEVPLGGVFRDGEAVRDAYTGATYTVRRGGIAAAAPGEVMLIERLAPAAAPAR
jgi:alpha-amylase